MNGDHNPLVDAHPALFRGTEPPAGAWVPEGWLPLVDKLCTDIEAVLGDEAQRFSVLQVKEKFGMLRFYWRLAKAPRHGQVRERETPMGTRIDVEAEDPLSVAIETLIAGAEAASATTCYRCGAAGALLSKTGWLYTACPGHRQPGSVEWTRDAPSS